MPLELVIPTKDDDEFTDFKSSMKKIGDMAMIAKNLADGKMDMRDLAEKVADLAGCGWVIQLMFGASKKPDKLDEVMNKLKELENKIDELGRNMASHFNDLKSFITEQSFFMDVVSPSSTLLKFVSDTIRNPCDRTFDALKREFEKNSPTYCAYKMITTLEFETTNPLKMAMKADPLKTRATHDKWRKIINGVFAQLFFLECYMNGLLEEKNLEGPTDLLARLLDFGKIMDGWRSDYEYQRYWWGADLKQFVEDIQNKNVQKTNKEKAELIRDGLNTILTTDAFYIVVYQSGPMTPAEEAKKTNAPSFPKPNQILESDCAGCVVIVYRSQEAHRITAKDISYIEDKVKAYSGYEITQPIGLILDFNLSTIVGHYVLIDYARNVAVESANCAFKWGPGWWITDAVTRNLPFGRPTRTVLLAGYI